MSYQDEIAERTMMNLNRLSDQFKSLGQMLAVNHLRACQGKAPAYSEDQIEDVATEIINLAKCI